MVKLSQTILVRSYSFADIMTRDKYVAFKIVSCSRSGEGRGGEGRGGEGRGGREGGREGREGEWRERGRGGEGGEGGR